jgi:hypothetical protein
MADNIKVKDADGNDVILRSLDSGGIHRPVHAGYDAALDAVKVLTEDGAGNPITSTTHGIKRRLDVDAVSSNITTKFRDAFEAYTPDTNWTEVKGSGDIIQVDGNAAAASYLVISKNPLAAGTESSLDSTLTFKLPVELSVGLSMSQRTVGQEFSVEIVDTQTPLADVADIAISSITQTTTVLTVDTTAAHGLVVGKSIGIRNCSNQLVNYQALVVASTPSPTQFTATAGPGGTIPTQTVTNPAGAKGFVFFRERLGRAQNGISQIFENATPTNASLYLRSEAGDALSSGTILGNHAVTVGTTASVALASGPFSYTWSPTTEFRIVAQSDRVQWSDAPVDTLTQSVNRSLRTQVCPDPSVTYKLRIRATNNKSLTVPNAQVVSVVKSGTTTGTFTTDVAHGYATGDLINYYGSSDQAATAFPNLVLGTTAITVTGANTFTAVIGTGTTGTAFGGYVAKVQGGNLMSSLGATAITAINATLTTLSDGTRQLVLTGSGTWTGATIGDYVNVVGCRTSSASLGVDGAWKVANLVTTALTLVPATAAMVPSLPANFGTTTCGGGVIRRTDLRLSFVRVFDYERERVELLARPSGDLAGAVPVVLQGGTTVVTGTLTGVTTVTTVTTVSTITSANLGIPSTIADVASAAITSSATVTAITPTFGTSYEVNIPVTAVAGTLPTLDVSIEESDDSGTNWFKVYDFPRITATGIYRSPLLPLIGNRVRYVQTVGGSAGQSFTRAINRLQSSHPAVPVRQLIDRALTINTLNATTASLVTADCGNRLQLVVSMGAITTTAPQFQLQGSDDGGLGWYNISSPLTGVASSTVQLTVVDINSALTRVNVSTAGSGATLNSLTLKAHD